MKAIDFTIYPNILKYVSNAIGKSFFKPFEYSDLDEETFIDIVSDFINEYEKIKTNLLKNTRLVYELTSNQTGYRVLSEDWGRMIEYYKNRTKPTEFSDELIEQWWDEKVGACICHIYQALQHNGKKIQGGVTGCLITIQYCIEFHDHEKKGYKYNVSSSFTFSLNLGHNIYKNYDLHE